MLARKSRVCAPAILMIVALGVVGPKAVTAAEKFLVDYRVTKWKTTHFDDAKTAGLHHTTVTKLGCQAKKESHSGHYDVSYVCPQWRRIALKTHNEAHQWEKWLRASGFETKHTH
jgi:hypothetical protein